MLIVLFNGTRHVALDDRPGNRGHVTSSGFVLPDGAPRLIGDPDCMACIASQRRTS